MARIRLGIYLEDDGPKLGRGKVCLLRAIREQGSISAAARSMGMAYRHAWIMVDELNRCFAEPVVVSTIGGSKGGGAALTAWGDELIERFEEMERVVIRSMRGQLRSLERRLASAKDVHRTRRSRASGSSSTPRP
jgi:molybdate transport system regulatory protein